MPKFRRYIAHLEGLWFDRTRHVSTCGAVSLEGLSLVGDTKSGFMYLPVRSAAVRHAMSNLPLTEHQNYTFVDLGSGKGRMLFLAAEYPFRKIEGVEFAKELHSEAQHNISRYRNRRKRCSEIASVNIDAADYEFPQDNLVIALFNPFGADVMQRVLQRLRESVLRSPRDVIMMLLYPELAAVVDPGQWDTLKSTRGYCLYRFRHSKSRSA